MLPNLTRRIINILPFILFDRFSGGFLVIWNTFVDIHANFTHKCPLAKFIWEELKTKNVKNIFFACAAYKLLF